MRQLRVPEKADGEQDAHEMIRFWVLDGESHLTINIGLFGPDEEARLWGSMIADIAVHAARGMAQDRPENGDAVKLLAEIESGYSARMNDMPETSGGLQWTH